MKQIPQEARDAAAKVQETRRIHHLAHTLLQTPEIYSEQHKKDHLATVTAHLGRHQADGLSPEAIYDRAVSAAEVRLEVLKDGAEDRVSIRQKATLDWSNFLKKNGLSDREIEGDALTKLENAMNASLDAEKAKLAELDAHEVAHFETDLLVKLTPSEKLPYEAPAMTELTQEQGDAAFASGDSA